MNIYVCFLDVNVANYRLIWRVEKLFFKRYASMHKGDIHGFGGCVWVNQFEKFKKMLIFNAFCVKAIKSYQLMFCSMKSVEKTNSELCVTNCKKTKTNVYSEPLVKFKRWTEQTEISSRLVLRHDDWTSHCPSQPNITRHIIALVPSKK